LKVIDETVSIIAFNWKFIMGQKDIGRANLKISRFVDPSFNIAMNNSFCLDNSAHLLFSIHNVIDAYSGLKVLTQTLICEDEIRVYKLFNLRVQLNHVKVN